MDFWRGKISARKLGVLIRHLPADSAFIQAAAPDVAAQAQWSATTHVLADVYDVLAVTGRLTDKRTKQPLPPYPRPADVIAARQREEARSAALVAQRKRLEERQAARQREQAQET